MVFPQKMTKFTTNCQNMTSETDYFSYKKLADKNSGFKDREKSGRLATLFLSVQ